jgi:hypothetical protein
MQNARALVLLVGGSVWPQTLVLAQRLYLADIDVVIIDCERSLAFDLECVHQWRTALGSDSALRAELRSWREHPRLRLVLPMVEDTFPACEAMFKGSGLLLTDTCTLSMNSLLSKSVMVEEARKAGLRTPRSLQIPNSEHAMSIARQWGYPVMLKGDGGRAGSQVRLCKDEAQVQAAYADLRLATESQLSLQEWVDGESWAAGGYFLDGRLTKCHLYEKLFFQGMNPLSPPERIRHEADPQALDGLIKLGRHLRWSGFGQIDFIRNRKGEFFFLEFNPRPWGSITAADAAGVDIMGALTHWIHREECPVDLDNKDGWSGLVYPKPLPRLAMEGRLLRIMTLILGGAFRRSRPRFSWSREIELAFLRGVYWNWRQRK